MASLSILIPTLPSRKPMFDDLVKKLISQYQSKGYDVEILFNVKLYQSYGFVESIGAKRNYLLDIAKKDYLCFIDDDDDVSEDYLDKVFEGINKGVDCCSLRGVITWDGLQPETFEHSIKYNAYATTKFNEIKYERYPNHLNVIKASIAKQFKFPEINHGEDTDWATQIFKSGLIKTEHYIDSVIYHYKYVTNK